MKYLRIYGPGIPPSTNIMNTFEINVADIRGEIIRIILGLKNGSMSRMLYGFIWDNRIDLYYRIWRYRRFSADYYVISDCKVPPPPPFVLVKTGSMALTY